MSTLADTKMLKSIYISILGFNILPNTPQTLAAYSLQGFCEGAYQFVCVLPVYHCQSAKVLICLCLGTLGTKYPVNFEWRDIFKGRVSSVEGYISSDIVILEHSNKKTHQHKSHTEQHK